MKYMGSKSKIAKYIVPIIQKYIDENGIDVYIEPFCGGCNIIDKIRCETKIANDNNVYLIELFRNAEKVKDLPDFITKEEYSKVRDCYNNHKKDIIDEAYPIWYIGAIGFLASYNGRFFDGGYAGIAHENGVERNMYLEAKNNFIKQSENLKDIIFSNTDYYSFNTNKVLYYCDPPYMNTKKYNTSRNFDYDKFYNWVREQSKDNIVLVSEQYMPDDFVCIWEKPVKRFINAKSKVESTEKLFVHRSLVV